MVEIELGLPIAVVLFVTNHVVIILNQADRCSHVGRRRGGARTPRKYGIKGGKSRLLGESGGDMNDAAMTNT